jgi:acetyl-CoA acyltransferase
MENFGCDPLGATPCCRRRKTWPRSTASAPPSSTRWCCGAKNNTADALANGSAFLRRFMTLPFDVPAPNFKKVGNSMTGDEGVSSRRPKAWPNSSPCCPAARSPSAARRTRPTATRQSSSPRATGRGNCPRDPKIAVRLHGFGLARAALAYMPEATVPAAQRALRRPASPSSPWRRSRRTTPSPPTTSSSPSETGADLKRMNNFGCSLVWGHPQAPMGTRAIIEVIEELALRGGGWGLFTGCAAGDTAMAVVLEVTATPEAWPT